MQCKNCNEVPTLTYCVECSSATVCLECSDNYLHPTSFDCSATCPAGYYPNS